MNDDKLNLRDKKEEEVLDVYNDVSNDIQIRRTIWLETKNVEVAEKAYDVYLHRIKKKDKNDR